MGRDLHILHFAHVPHCVARVDKHFDDYGSLQLITRGRVHLSYDEVGFELSLGSWWTCYPGPRIRFSPLTPGSEWEHRYIAFSGRLFRQWRSDGLLFDHPQVLPRPDLIDRFDQMLSFATRPDAISQRRTVNLLEGILLELADHRRTDHPVSPLVRAAMDLLCDPYVAAPGYGQLADRLGVSLTTLRRSFRRDTGAALHHYVLHLRLTEAKRLLGDTELSIKAIARQLGYGDVCFFSRQFRQLAGTPPAAYRRSRQH